MHYLDCEIGYSWSNGYDCQKWKDDNLLRPCMQHKLGGWDEDLCKKKLTEFCHDLPDEGFCVDEWKGRYTMEEVNPSWVEPG